MVFVFTLILFFGLHSLIKICASGMISGGMYSILLKCKICINFCGIYVFFGVVVYYKESVMLDYY